MSENQHTYPGFSAAEAKSRMEQDPQQQSDYTKHLRTRPSLLDSTDCFTYDSALEKNLKIVATGIVEDVKKRQKESASVDMSADNWFSSQVSYSKAWYEQLKHIPPAVQEDDSFWRYLTVAILASDQAARLRYLKDGKAIEMPIGAVKSNVSEQDDSTKRSADIIAKRMFVRGRLQANGVNCNDAWQEYETSHIFPGSYLDAQPVWQGALYTAAKNVSTSPAKLDAGRKAATKINSARSARIASATDKAAADKLAKKLAK